jgi:hypothetical protein
VSGTLRVLSDIAPGAGCRDDACLDAPPAPVTPLPDINALFKIQSAAAGAGGTVTVPLIIKADAEVQSFSFSVDFDEEVLDALAIERLFQKPDGTEYGFASLTINNRNDTPGSAGIDEGYLVGGVVFSQVDRCNNLPANRESEVLGFRFRVKPGTQAASTEVKFIDGAKSPGDPVRNVLVAMGQLYTPELASSFVFFDGRITVLPEITTFVRGDSNGEGLVDLSDAAHALTYLFLGGERPACYDAADATDDGVVDIADPILVLTSLFLGTGTTIPPPYPQRGEDPTPDGLGCLFRS